MDDSLARYRPYLAMVFLFLIVLAGTIFVLRRPEPSALTILTPAPRATATLAVVVVDLRGAVSHPGVYTLPSGGRVEDALELAGGLGADADTTSLNLARKLVDGEQIYVLKNGEATPSTAPAGAAAPASKALTVAGKININTASISELDVLPGIGPALAQRIVDYRTQNGPFREPEDLKNVRGIGDVLFDQIKGMIVVE